MGWWAMLYFRQYPFQSELQICASGSESARDLFTRCCPLQLAADDADFMGDLFLGSDRVQSHALSIRVTLMLLIWVLLLPL